jgi:hypothetical protein
MKITAGITNLSELKHAIDYGAGEVYCGILGVMNHRPLTKEYNFQNLNELVDAIRIAHESNVKIYFLANELYRDEEVRNIVVLLKILQRLNIDGVIVRDLALISLLHKSGFEKKLILSSLAGVFNSEALKVYRKLNISRLVLPQHLKVPEIVNMRKKVKMETEVFFGKEEYCKNIDGRCFFHDLDLFQKKRNSYVHFPHMPSSMKEHGAYRQMSFTDYPCDYDFKTPQGYRDGRQKIDSYLRTSFLEDFYALFHIGIEYAKIKRYRGSLLLSQLWLARELIGMLKIGTSKKNFLKKGKETVLYIERNGKSNNYPQFI